MSKIGFLVKYANDGQHYKFDDLVDSAIKEPYMKLDDWQAIGRSTKLKPEHVDKIISSRPGLHKSMAGDDFVHEVNTRGMLNSQHIETMYDHARKTGGVLEDWMPIHHSDRISDDYLTSNKSVHRLVAARNNKAARKVLDAAKETPKENPYGASAHVGALRNLNVLELHDLSTARESNFPQVKAEAEHASLKLRLSASKNQDKDER